MKILKSLLPLCLLVLFGSCLTPRKMDAFVAASYNNALLKPDKKKKTEVVLNAAFPLVETSLSATTKKTDRLLPLLLYWQMRITHRCALNPAIAFTQFSNAFNTQATHGLNQKLAGRKLELTVEQLPAGFALVDKSHMIWLVYAFAWDRIYIQPDGKDLVVTYKLSQGTDSVKSGRVVVKNPLQNQGVRIFQSWRSATEEHLTELDVAVGAMARECAKKLLEEI